MLANACPFAVILRGIGAIRLYICLIFDSDSEAVIRLNTRIYERFQQKIGECEIVICGIVLIGIKVAEDIGDINEAVAAEGASDVVQTGIGNAGLGEIMEKFVEAPASERGLTATVHWLYGLCFLLALILIVVIFIPLYFLSFLSVGRMKMTSTKVIIALIAERSCWG